MRLKLYYTADEIIKNLYTTGSEFMTEDAREYIGAYHVYITGEVYTEAIWNAKISKALIPYKNTPEQVQLYQTLKPEVDLQFNAPTLMRPMITSTQIAAGYIDRFFLKKINENIFIEIDAAQYTDWKSRKIDNIVYSAVQITWYIAGTIEDTNNGAVSMPGVRSKNLLQLKYAETVLPGIRLYITDPLQFYTDTTYVVPADIN